MKVFAKCKITHFVPMCNLEIKKILRSIKRYIINNYFMDVF